MGKRVLVTGGAGFVGSHLALRVKQTWPDAEVTALDNLRRRGSELGLPRLRKAGVRFVHGDIRVVEDLEPVGPVDLIIECSAEPSVLAGLQSGPQYVVQTNLGGTLNCLELARRHDAAMIFLSTSRVYPVARLGRIPYTQTPSRFEIAATPDCPPGLSEHGVSEQFSLDGARSLYGATKLCSELMVQEYADAYDMPAIIDRCGVITGPWQMGKVDQGVVVHWILSHLFERPLAYIGYGGEGKQVRDMLAVSELGELIVSQIRELADYRGEVFNVGGGRACSVSLRELTELCVAATGHAIDIASVTETRPADIPIFITDARKVMAAFSWAPSNTPAQIVEETTRWAVDHRDELAATLLGS